MKTVLSFFSAALLLLSCSGNDSGTNPTAGNQAYRDSVNGMALADSTRFAAIQWMDSIEQSIGKIKKGEVKDVSWRFRNTGSHPLIIAHVQPGCGCTVAEQPEAPIPPGEEGVIRAKFDTRSQSTGMHHKNVMVQANTPDRSYYLLFTAEVTE